VAEKKRTVHLLITATYETDEPIPSRFISHAVRDIIERTELLNQITTYQMPYAVPPMHLGLKEVCRRMGSSYDEFAERYPDLAMAISLMVGVEDGDEGIAGNARNLPSSNGQIEKA
jgi:hypothetical protein